MKKNIGPVLGLYPTPTTVIGTVIDGKVNWLHVAHIGIIGLDRLMISSNKAHYSNQGIRKNRTLSINLVNEDMLVEADFVGIASGNRVDKSSVFTWHEGTVPNAPLLDKSYVCMECEVVDIYDYGNYDNFILKVVNTYVDEDKLTEEGRIDYDKVCPILFEMPTKTYRKTGEIVGKCWNVGKEYK